VLALIPASEDGDLTLCVGAGVSRADDAALPLAGALAEQLCDWLEQTLDGFQAPADRTNILLVADAAEAVTGDLRPLQDAVLKLADFTGAKPNLGHLALAMLLAEGAVHAVLSWNWDTCIERAAPPDERVEVALSQEAVANLRIPALVKVHGCALQAPTLLITSAQLTAPPPWSNQTMAEKLARGRVVFVGIGDVAGYADQRIQELVNEMELGGIAVVSPSIVAGWENSRWSTVAPKLAESSHDRIPLDADTFLDGLLRAWVRWTLDTLDSLAGGAANLAVLRASDLVTRTPSLRFARWCRAAAISPAIGRSAVRDDLLLQLLIAAAALSLTDGGDEIRLEGRDRVRWGDRRITGLVVGTNAAPASVRREVERRVLALSESGQAETTNEILLAGTALGALTAEFDIEGVDVFGEADEDDVFEGPLAAQASVRWAHEVVSML
jgi:hypothetical protein